MKIKNIILIAIIFLTGCTTTYWGKPNQSWTKQELHRDWAECMALRGQAGNLDSVLVGCMFGKGWEMGEENYLNNYE